MQLPSGSKALLLRALRCYIDDLQRRKHQAERRVVWVPPFQRKTEKGRKRYEASRKSARRAYDMIEESNRAFKLREIIKKWRPTKDE